MAKTNPTKSLFEEKAATLVGPVLLLVLVGVSAFLLGRSYQGNQTPTTTVSGDSTVPSDPSAINKIQSALNAPPAAAPTATSTSSAPKSQTTTSTSHSASSTAKPPSNGITNINTADLTALEALTGIGPTKAQAIIDYRTQNGPFIKVDDLVNVKGIGPKTLDKIRAQITV